MVVNDGELTVTVEGVNNYSDPFKNTKALRLGPRTIEEEIVVASADKTGAKSNILINENSFFFNSLTFGGSRGFFDSRSGSSAGLIDFTITSASVIETDRSLFLYQIGPALVFKIFNKDDIMNPLFMCFECPELKKATLNAGTYLIEYDLSTEVAVGTVLNSSVEFSVQEIKTVPLPSSMWLLGASLIGFLKLAKRNIKSA